MAQDDYYYEIQLTNKQLVFYFMAGATGLILSFLAGVMIGRGVDGAAGEVQAARPVQEDRIVSEEAPARTSPPPPTEDLNYAKTLESDRSERLADIHAPTLVVHGTDDPLVPYPNGELLARRISGARLVSLPGCGHMPMWERPADLVRELSAFFAAEC